MLAEALDPVYQRIHSFVMNSKFCKHFDETSWRDKGKRHYVWLACYEQAAVYMIDKSRSAEAFQELFTVCPDDIDTNKYTLIEFFECYAFRSEMNFGMLGSDSFMSATCEHNSVELDKLRAI